MFYNAIVSTPDGNVQINGFIGRGCVVTFEHIATGSRNHASCLTVAEANMIAAQCAALATV